MKQLSRVVWSEGMYLGPHHFQTQSRYFEDSIRFAIEHTWFEPWGFIEYKLDENSIRNGRVSVSSAHGIFEDGLIFVMPECDACPVEKDITSLLSPLAESIIVFLAVPQRRQGECNCDLEGTGNGTRYRAIQRSIRDVNNGIDEKEIGLCEKNIRIVTEAETQPGLLTIPLARVKRDGSGQLGYDPSFVPPCTQLTASSWLTTFLGELIEILEEKRKALLLPRISPGKFMAGMNQVEVSKFWFLHAINDALTMLRHIYASKKRHPEELFRELSRLAGVLCTFSVDSDPTMLPIYDHRQLDHCFQLLGTHIRRHLEILVPSNTIEIRVQQSQPNFYMGEIQDLRCLGRSRWVLGLGSSAGEAQVLSRAPQLVKVCSAFFIAELVKRAVPGLSLVHLPVPPAEISPKVELQYFAISKSGPCWDHIVDTKQVGFYVPNELPDPVVELQVILER